MSKRTGPVRPDRVEEAPLPSDPAPPALPSFEGDYPELPRDAVPPEGAPPEDETDLPPPNEQPSWNDPSDAPPEDEAPSFEDGDEDRYAPEEEPEDDADPSAGTGDLL